jgi:Fe-S oxidoreductase
VDLERFRRDVWDCVRCSNCKFVHPWRVKSQRFSKVCPSSARYLFDAYSAQGRMDIVRGIIDGELSHADSRKLLDIVYRCTLCGACDVTCKFFNDLDPLLIFEELRSKCVEDGKAPLPEHKAITDSVKSYANVWLQPRDRRGRWARSSELKDVTKEKAEALYYVGCTYAFDPRLQKVPQETANLLRKAGVDVGILGGKEVCCGSPVLRVGDKTLFEKLASENLETFKRLGVKKIITSCAGCYSTFKADYPRIGTMEAEVLHIAEYIDVLIKEGRLKFNKELPLTVTYHDPCHLGRRSEPFIHWEGKRVKYGRYDPPKELRRGTHGIYEPPREVLRAIPGVELVEMERIKEYAWCCGSGGGVKSAFPDFALWTASERIEEAEATGADVLATCCPWCESNLEDALKEMDYPLRLTSLVSLVSQVV